MNDRENIDGENWILNTDFKAYLRPDSFLSIIEFDEVFHEEDRTSNNLLYKQSMKRDNTYTKLTISTLARIRDE